MSSCSGRCVWNSICSSAIHCYYRMKWQTIWISYSNVHLTFACISGINWNASIQHHIQYSQAAYHPCRARWSNRQDKHVPKAHGVRGPKAPLYQKTQRSQKAPAVPSLPHCRHSAQLLTRHIVQYLLTEFTYFNSNIQHCVQFPTAILLVTNYTLSNLSPMKITSSSAVVERPHDALCPSVASLNKITRAESLIIVT